MGAKGIRHSLLGLILLLGAAFGLGASEISPTARMVPGRPHFRAFRATDGLPQGTIMAITFTREGVLWVGTQDGAAWNDGRAWNVVDMPNRGVSNYLEAICQASDGSLWFGRQDGGAAQLKQGVWRTFGRAEGLPAERVTSIVETRGEDGRPVLWLGTLGGGVARRVGESWEILDKARGLPDPRVWKLVSRRRDQGAEEVWVCGEAGMLARIDAKGQVHVMPGLPARSINSLLETQGADGGLELWITTYGLGVGHFKQGAWRFFTTRDGLPSDFSTDVAQTRSLEGHPVTWFSTVAGLVRLERGQFRCFDVRWGMPTDSVYRLHRDPYRADALWIGTSGGGLLYYQEGSWLTHDAAAGLPGNFITALGHGRDDRGEPAVLVGTSVGLARFEQGAWRSLELPPELRTARVMAFLDDPREDALWVGTLAGLAQRKAGRWTLFGTKEGLPHPAVGCLLQTEGQHGRGVLWVGTQGGGLARLEEGRWTVQSTRTGLPSDTLLALAETREHGRSVLWAGFRGGGIGRCREGQWTFWSRDRGFPNNVVSAIHVSPRPGGRQELWVGTVGGGVAWSPIGDGDPQWQVISTGSKPGLPSDTVHQIQEDAEGRLYCSTNRGVLRLTRTGSGHALEHFTVQDGLPSDQCSPTASLVDARGHVWIGTVFGLGELDPGTPVEPEAPRPLVFQNAWVREKARPIQPDRPLELGPRERDLAVEFGLLSYRKESEQQFRTHMVGLDPYPGAWSVLRRREFTNLAPGRYRFQVWAKDWTGVERGPVELEILVRPAWWETWWFLVLAVGILGGVAVLAVRWRMGAMVRRARMLRQLVQRQTQELVDANSQMRKEIEDRIAAEGLKDEFVSIVSHELRTPLTSIRGALGLLQGGVLGGLAPEIGRLVGLAHDNALRLQTLVNDLLDVQKITSGKLTLEPRPSSLNGLVERLLATSEGLSKASGVEFRWLERGADLVLTMDAGRIEQVLSNLLSNAAKFSPKDRPVEIRVGAHGEWARVSVTNFGPPVPVEFHDRIFTKFAQAESSAVRARGGTGLGLAISRALVELHGGRIGFQSDEGGTIFWFELPLG